MIQLCLSPSHGWEDVSAQVTEPQELWKRGVLPLLVVASLSAFMRYAYVSETSFAVTLERCVLTFGAYFVSVYVARLIFDMYLGHLVEGEPNSHKANTVIMYAIGLMALAQLICNLFPPDINILRFMPLYVVLVVYKSSTFLAVRQQADIAFLFISAVATVIVPLVLYYLLMLIIS